MRSQEQDQRCRQWWWWWWKMSCWFFWQTGPVLRCLHQVFHSLHRLHTSKTFPTLNLVSRIVHCSSLHYLMLYTFLFKQVLCCKRKGKQEGINTLTVSCPFSHYICELLLNSDNIKDNLPKDSWIQWHYLSQSKFAVSFHLGCLAL